MSSDRSGTAGEIASVTEFTPLYPADLSVLEDHSRPSLFELLAEEQLRDILHPVVRYVLSYLAQNYPRYFLRVLNHHEEVFAALLLIVERHHLKKHNASLSEHFYGLRLAPSQTIPTPRLNLIEAPRRAPSLNRKQRWGMLLVLVGLPYLRSRAQDYYERLGGGRSGEDDAEPEIHATSIKQRLFKSLYPYVNLAFDATLIGYDIAYLFGRSMDYRPWHRVLGLKIQRRDQEDEVPPSSNLLSKLPPLLPPLLLLLKLSQWWYSPTSPRLLTSTSSTGYNQSTSSAKIHAGVLPPRRLRILPDILRNMGRGQDGSGSSGSEDEDEPPELDGGSEKKTLEKIEEVVQIGVDGYGICPVCREKWQNPAILPSGWVVCWRCGWEAVEGETDEEDDDEEGTSRVEGGESELVGGKAGVRENKGPRRRGKCPITGVYVGEGQLRRVLV